MRWEHWEHARREAAKRRSGSTIIVVLRVAFSPLRGWDITAETGVGIVPREQRPRSVTTIIVVP